MAGPVHYHTGKFPPQEFDWPRLIPLLGPASAALARYGGLLTAIPNAEVLLSPLTTQEAVLSSRIEGTQATMGEVLEYEAGAGEAMDPKKREDIHEVINYRKAVGEATEKLQSLPLCNRLIKELHETLLSGVRGHDKARGKFRTIQNYIAAEGRPIEKARFIPIAPEALPAGMSRWEKYLHEEVPDLLVQLAIVHAEFESLHPFLDGNGRIGRMVIPLFLFGRRLLHAPMFYLSEYLETNRQEYYDRLLAVSRDDDWTGWCQFFLEALTRQAGQNEAKARLILDLYQKKKGWIVDATHSHHAIHALDFLFHTPIFGSAIFIAQAKIPQATARRILRLLVKHRVLREIRKSSGRRSAVYAFVELLNIAEGRKAF
jgi:Fic family protein